MTSLPISLPPDYSLVVKVGDEVTSGQLLARSSIVDDTQESPTPISGHEVVIDLSTALGGSTDSVRRFLKKAPGDSVERGDVIAQKLSGLGLKKYMVVSDVSGTVTRYERDTGKLFIRADTAAPHDIASTPESTEILSPLAGTISVCNNDQIVIETESKALIGTAGFGGSVTGEIMVISPEKDTPTITSAQITKDAIGKILLLPNIDIEALVKADAIGVAGVLGIGFSEQLMEFLKSRKLDFPIIVIDPIIGKKLVKIKNPVTLHGEEMTVLLQE